MKTFMSLIFLGLIILSVTAFAEPTEIEFGQRGKLRLERVGSQAKYTFKTYSKDAEVSFKCSLTSDDTESKIMITTARLRPGTRNVLYPMGNPEFKKIIETPDKDATISFRLENGNKPVDIECTKK